MSALLVAAGLAALAGGLHVGPHALRLLQEAQLRRRCAGRRALVLTYDDGPSTSLTPRLLDLLARHGARATFFVLGSAALREPALLERAAGEGHEIGSHAFFHWNAWKTAPWQTTANLLRGEAAVAPYRSGKGPALHRPPNGKLTAWNALPLWWRGGRLGWWTLDTEDSREPFQADRGRVLDALDRAGGGVVLMHDYAGSPERERFVLDVSEALLAHAADRDLEVMTLGALLSRPR